MNFANISQKEIDDIYKNISARVKCLREEKKMSQLELSLEIGIKSVAFYSNCENNRYGKHFNLEHLYKIAKALEIDVRDLII
ncbi:MAG: helix-turn-helix transcriptional regulator [Sulfurimonas sp.]|uniref:helix-turn-helix domain-containing protein n=1 Tax=Sulfurimonas sp. TaxID=2022749 RepID=UPI0026158B5F|nr:helix-turn-helix transcriptional regulator [Sulfurimonas sp.]MDD2653168.1 helix-turn-helix transcriptional regulator [Sulfurimonas sp.]MDD3450590.1 helix-turn-helix transcriptional regulator [Sulfurimonas sp.]